VGRAAPTSVIGLLICVLWLCMGAGAVQCFRRASGDTMSTSSSVSAHAVYFMIAIVGKFVLTQVLGVTVGGDRCLANAIANTGGQGKRSPISSVVAVTRHSGGVLTARLYSAKRTVTWRTMEYRRGDTSHQL
jgi:hypothetical protein